LQGDPNVPAGEVSITVELTKPMVLTREQQADLATLAQISPDDPPPTLGDGLATFRQPFYDPTHSADYEDMPPYPAFCLCRYWLHTHL